MKTYRHHTVDPTDNEVTFSFPSDHVDGYGYRLSRGLQAQYIKERRQRGGFGKRQRFKTVRHGWCWYLPLHTTYMAPRLILLVEDS